MWSILSTDYYPAMQSRLHRCSMMDLENYADHCQQAGGGGLESDSPWGPGEENVLKGTMVTGAHLCEYTESH